MFAFAELTISTSVMFIDVSLQFVMYGTLLQMNTLLLHNNSLTGTLPVNGAS